MWKSPIEIQIEAAQTELIEKEEQLILNMVQQVTGRVINKQQLLDALDYNRSQYDIGFIEGTIETRKTIIAAIKEDFEVEYWLDDVIRTIIESWPEMPAPFLDCSPDDPPDDCDYEIGYDPFLGCIMDDC